MQSGKRAKRDTVPVDLALQGGGAHGAFHMGRPRPSARGGLARDRRMVGIVGSLIALVAVIAFGSTFGSF